MSMPLKFLAVTLALVSLAACSTISGGDSGASKSEPVSSGQPQAQIQTETFEESNYYYDFGDILVPSELTFQSEESYVFDTRSFKSGVMIFTGRVVNADLVNFFINSMTKDGWTLVTSLKAQKSILIFEKFNKSASIQILDGFKSKITIVAVEAKGGPGTSMQPSGGTMSSSPAAVGGPASGSSSKKNMKEQELN